MLCVPDERHFCSCPQTTVSIEDAARVSHTLSIFAPGFRKRTDTQPFRGPERQPVGFGPILILFSCTIRFSSIESEPRTAED
jgi:hypothetical protein